MNINYLLLERLGQQGTSKINVLKSGAERKSTLFSTLRNACGTGKKIRRGAKRGAKTGNWRVLG